MSLNKSHLSAVLSAAHGTPHDVLKTVVGSHIKDALSPAQQSRLENATEDAIRIYPDKIGRYTVHSLKEDSSDHSEYTIDMKYEDGKTCTCEDYMYRCDPGSNQMCKHLWRGTLLVELDALPLGQREPYDWLLDELVRDQRRINVAEEVQHQDEALEQLESLISEVKDTHRISVDYPQVCTARANILQSSFEGIRT